MYHRYEGRITRNIWKSSRAGRESNRLNTASGVNWAMRGDKREESERGREERAKTRTKRGDSEP